jgi:hypothetical protein
MFSPVTRLSTENLSALRRSERRPPPARASPLSHGLTHHAMAYGREPPLGHRRSGIPYGCGSRSTYRPTATDRHGSSTTYRVAPVRMQRPRHHRWTRQPDSRTMAQNYGDLESDYAKFPCRMLCFFGHSPDRGRDPGFRRPGVGHHCVLDIRGSALGSPVLRSP